MNLLSSLGSSLFSPPKTAALLTAATPPSLPSQKTPAALTTPASELVSLSKTGIDLSKQPDALAQRVDSLGKATVGMAQNFLTSFARSLFGDAANGMTVAFDSASVSASSSFSGALKHSAGSGGSSDAASFRMEDNSSFVGKGVITTADGHRFNFEVEVHYQAVAEAAASRTTSVSNQPAGGPTPPKSEQHAAPKGDDLFVGFPGTITDLFHMMDRNTLQISFQLPSSDQGDGKAKQGNLTLRLLDLIESPKGINAKLAKAYGACPAPAPTAATNAAESVEKS